MLFFVILKTNIIEVKALIRPFVLFVSIHMSLIFKTCFTYNVDKLYRVSTFTINNRLL